MTGNADDVASLSGTVAGDLFVFGDIRDVVREGKHLVMGEDTDRLVLGLATAGLAVTAATYVSVGGVAPVRAGLTLVKDARKVGRLGEGLTEWAGRSARDIIDAPVLEKAVASALGDAAGSNRLCDTRRVPCREGRCAGPSRQGRRTRSPRRPARAGRSTRCIISEGPNGRCARRTARGVQRRPDPRHPQGARPRRPAAGGRRVQSIAVDIQRPAGAVRISIVDQGHHRTADPIMAAAQEGTAVAAAIGGRGPSRSGRRRRARLVCDRLCRPFPHQTEEPMPSFHNGDVEIAYLDEGEGDPIVLVHGFASSKNVNWVYPAWVSELKKNGRRVIALDNRGHGDSSKLYDSEKYYIGTMAGDVTALMDHLNIERADMMGYSLGGRMTGVSGAEPAAAAALRDFRRTIGMGLIEGGGPGENVAEALEAPSLGRRDRSRRATFRAFADQTRSDRRALAACLRGSRRLMTREEAASITVPVLIAVGTVDEIAGSAAALGRSLQARRCSIFPTATTCARSATRSTRRACWNFCLVARNRGLEFPRHPDHLETTISGEGNFGRNEEKCVTSML